MNVGANAAHTSQARQIAQLFLIFQTISNDY